jgi:hypothetical protein
VTKFKFLLPAVLATLLASPGFAVTINGSVIDATTKTPIEGAFVTLGGTSVRSDKNGKFQLQGSGDEVRARAYGHRRSALGIDAAAHAPVIELTPFTPRALYLSSYGIGSLKLRNAALDIAGATPINTLVIDIKTDSAIVGYKSAVPLATAIGAQKIITVHDMPAQIARLHEQGLYTIARIVTFKDNLLATAKPELAVRDKDGKVWHDREGLAWADPFQPAVREYNLALAEEAAKMGFDEVQFDYIRFPDTRGLVFSKANTEENRVAAITALLAAARARLAPYNVFVSADVFGYVCWNLNDTEIGQRLDALAANVDYISPMLYPSGFQYGIPGYRNPVANSYEIVYRTLERARERSNLDPVRFRPWLQAFRDYAFDRRAFGVAEIQQQISAAEHFGNGGWLLWNPRNVYSAETVKTVTETAGN